jgi:hypothetical protein
MPSERARNKTAAALGPVPPPIGKVIPLLHVPDDPGPEAEAPTEPQAEPPTDPAPDGWRRLREIFK